MLSKCKFGGGHGCKRQGGDGSSFHKSTYCHAHTSTREFDRVADGFIVKSSNVVVPLSDLEDSFDDEVAKSTLSAEIFSIVLPKDVISKALYDIDVNSVDGITRVLSLLPILDPEILKMIYQECFPGYDPEALSPRMMRIELRGYLTDVLQETIENGETQGTEPATEDDATAATAEAGDIDSSEITEAGDDEGTGQVPDSTGVTG